MVGRFPAGQYHSLEVCSLVFSLVCQSVSSWPTSAGAPGPNCGQPFPTPHGVPNPERSHIYSVDPFIQWFIARQCSHPTFHAHTESNTLFIARQCSHPIFHTHTESNTLSGRSHPSVASYQTVSFSRSGYLS